MKEGNLGFKSFYSIFQGAKGKGDRGKKKLLENDALSYRK